MQSSRPIVIIASDHNGVEQKACLKDYLRDAGFACLDLGPRTAKVSVDYVDYAYQLANIVAEGPHEVGILLCGTGVGMSIVANKVNGVRAALVHNLESASKSREHNDSNVLCLGAWINSLEVNTEITTTWLQSKFGEFRHVRRVAKIDAPKPNKIVFTNGCFDILHQGHIALLSWARGLGDKLIVGMNSDESVSRLKGPSRPINNENDRKAVLQALKCVDEVVIFNEDKPTDVIRQTKPDIVVKGGEWTADEVRVRDDIPSAVDIKIYPIVQGYSSTKVIQRIRA